MRVTEKGQVTIPKPVRRSLRIEPGSEVEFVLRDGEALLRRIEPEMDERKKRVATFMTHRRSFIGVMDIGGLSTDEFMSLSRD